MNMKLIYVYLVALTAIGGIGLLVKSDTVTALCFCLVIALSLITVIFEVRRSRFEKRKNRQNALEAKEYISSLNKMLAESEEYCKEYREVVDLMEQKLNYYQDEINELKQQKNSQADLYMFAFRDHIVRPYLEMLRSVEMPLQPNDKQQIIDRTIELAMMAVDMGDCVEWSISNREEQRLNCALVEEKISIEDAKNQALPLTDNPATTPKWARALNASFKDIVSKDNNIIYSGYKTEQ